MSGLKDSLDRIKTAGRLSPKARRNQVQLASTYSKPCAAYSYGSGLPFALEEGETIASNAQNYVSLDLSQIQEKLDVLDRVLIEEVARSRALTSLQCAELVSMRLSPYTRETIGKHLSKLVSLRALRQKSILRPGSKSGLRFYELDVFGNDLVRDHVYFHSGNRFLSWRRQQEIGAEETALSIKRILCANQILVGLLKNGAKMERFGVQEIFAFHPNGAGSEGKGPVFRASATAVLDEQSILAYEVVRDTEESMAALEEKITRYYGLVDAMEAEYENEGRENGALKESGRPAAQSRFHEDENADFTPGDPLGMDHPPVPQLVLCAETYEHAKKIQNRLKEKDLLRDKDPILFTEDRLNFNDSLVSLYELKEDSSRQWYRIPGAVHKRTF